MKPLGSPREHYWLAQRMAHAGGVDLAAAQADGALAQDDWAALVETCRACTWAQGCRRWLALAEQESHDPLDIPDTCPNRVRFARIVAADTPKVTP